LVAEEIPVALGLAMLVGGGVLLYFGAEWLVAGAAGLARALGISALLVGLTVVAYGTSMPEVVVGIGAALGGHRDIALGNVVGSNIANLGLILGLTALVRPTRVDEALPRREVPVLVVTALLVPLLLLDGDVDRWEGAGLVGIALLYTAWMVRTSRASVGDAAEAAAVTAAAADAAGAPEPTRSRGRLVGLALGGLAGLVVGGHVFVEGAIAVAHEIGMSERLVGLTVVAIGTSLPELATSLIAAYRGHSDIAVGNVLGSNIFNVLLCLGTASLAGTIGAPLASVAVDVGAMVVFTLAAALMMRTARTVTRAEAAILVLGYAAFVALLAARG
jgi:cation:H+ antiporter